MKLTLGNLLAAQPALKKLLNTDMPVTTAFKLSKVAKDIDKEFAEYEEQRVKLVQKYGAADDQGNVSVKDEYIQTFMDDISKLHAIECELPGDPIGVDQLGEIKMTAAEMAALDGVIQ